MKVQENIPISTLTTMRLGGPARYVIEVESETDIPAAYAFARERNLPVFILGGGANTIGRDEGFLGVIIKNAMRGITMDGGTLTAMGGEEWDAVVAYASTRGFTGIEALSKIPGLSGAAPVQNIGAYGQDVSQTFHSARVYDTTTGQFTTLSKDDFHFAYRTSILNTTEKGRFFVISITLNLTIGQMPRPFYNSIERHIEAHHLTDFSPQSIREIVSTIRKDKLPDPLEKASAGSFFKNVYLSEAAAAAAEKNGLPVYHGHDGLKINSGWLIESAGLKGQLLHGMRVSPTAALVLINESAKNYQDLALARAEIIQAVQAKFGFTLEQEPAELYTPDAKNSVTRSAHGNNNQKENRPNKVSHSAHVKTKLLNGRDLADFIKERQAHQISTMKKKPHLLIIRDSNNPIITKYVELKQHYGADIGVTVTDFLAKDTATIREKILSASEDPTINGIILQLPIKEKDQTDSLTALIAPEKDVDGLSGTGHFDSATATAIHWLLTGYDIPLENQKIALVGRGKLVGAPLYKMFTASHYDVTMFHRGDDLTKLRNFDIIISATGVPGLISDSLVRPGAVVIDAGTASENGVIKGDLADSVRARTDLSAITPVIGGVGPLTVTCLFDHIIQAASATK